MTGSKKDEDISYSTFHMKKFGSKMFIAAILSIVTIASDGFAAFIMYSVLYLAAKDLQLIYTEVYNENLKKFISRIKVASLIQLFTGILLLVFTVLFFISIFRLVTYSSKMILLNATIFLTILMFLLLIQILGFVFMIRAWDNLNEFMFESDLQIFGRELYDGTKKLQKAYIALIISSLFGILAILVGIISLPEIASSPSALFFIISNRLILSLILISIPNVIGYITMIQGYFKLASLKEI